MEEFIKRNVPYGLAGFIAGGTGSIYLVWAGPAHDIVLQAIKFLGLLVTAFLTSACTVWGKSWAEKRKARKANKLIP